VKSIPLEVQAGHVVDRWTVIICRELGLDRPGSASSNSLFKGLPSRLRLSFSSNVSTFNSSKFSSFLLWSKMVQPAALLKNLISTYIVGLLNNLNEV
jgi:hypothetical protein